MNEPSRVDEDNDKAGEIKKRMDKIDCELVQNGGNNCGWDAADHKDFLRIRTKHNNKTVTLAFINEMRRAVPNCDEIDITAHVDSH